ncbi:MAG: cupin-like domain-containing protein [Oculatellaceae cyanobacterium Prado106]|jgi:lysine-specific demethylase 8/hypoxia-inducible factor 1-alpha inhibitor (HIF hydroxylase)|nr:cupin-like domain-containing protein [Oculatellaceae cyanobacterium Prado106]
MQYPSQNGSDWNSAIAPHSSHPPVIPRVSAPEITPQIFQQFYRPGTPLVVTGLLSDLNWNLETLNVLLGDIEFPIRCYGRSRYQQDKRQWTSAASGVAARMMKFSEYVACLQSGEAAQQDWYLAKCALSATPLAQTPALEQVEARLGLRSPATGWNLWVGANHLEQVHYDASDGTLVQLQGQKRVVLFPPSQLYNLYPSPLWKHLRHGLNVRAGQSYVYIEHPDFTAFPRFQQALKHRYEVLLNPGDLLFLPVGWWHEVTTVGTEPVCSINRFWMPPSLRGWRSWSMWRVHLGSVLAMPHVLGELLSAVVSPERSAQLRKLFQKL